MEQKETFGGSAGVDTERLMKELGQGRRFHLVNYVLLALPVYVAAYYAINYVFLAADVPYRYTPRGHFTARTCEPAAHNYNNNYPIDIKLVCRWSRATAAREFLGSI